MQPILEKLDRIEQLLETTYRGVRYYVELNGKKKYYGKDEAKRIEDLMNGTSKEAHVVNDTHKVTFLQRGTDLSKMLYQVNLTDETKTRRVYIDDKVASGEKHASGEKVAIDKAVALQTNVAVESASSNNCTIKPYILLCPEMGTIRFANEGERNKIEKFKERVRMSGQEAGIFVCKKMIDGLEFAIVQIPFKSSLHDKYITFKDLEQHVTIVLESDLGKGLDAYNSENVTIDMSGIHNSFKEKEFCKT